MDVDNIKKEYAKKITNKIKNNKEFILESFIEFYGEKYRDIITTRFNDISFLYYINDFTIFYIVDSLKNGYDDKFKNIFFAIPYIIHIIKNDLYKKEVTPQNFLKLGLNKIIGSSSDELLKDKELLKYSIGLALREDNTDPYEFNLPIHNGIKRIISIPVFSIDDKTLFHEINHAICSEYVDENNIKCGLICSSKEENFSNEIINDIITLEIYNIFKRKCSKTILNDNVMQDALSDGYIDYHDVIYEFYEKNKERIKNAVIDSDSPQLLKTELEHLTNLINESKKRSNDMNKNKTNIN